MPLRLAERRRRGVVHVDVVEDEAAAVQVHHDLPGSTPSGR